MQSSLELYPTSIMFPGPDDDLRDSVRSDVGACSWLETIVTDNRRRHLSNTPLPPTSPTLPPAASHAEPATMATHKADPAASADEYASPGISGLMSGVVDLYMHASSPCIGVVFSDRDSPEPPTLLPPAAATFPITSSYPGSSPTSPQVFDASSDGQSSFSIWRSPIVVQFRHTMATVSSATTSLRAALITDAEGGRVLGRGSFGTVRLLPKSRCASAVVSPNYDPSLCSGSNSKEYPQVADEDDRRSSSASISAASSDLMMARKVVHTVSPGLARAAGAELAFCMRVEAFLRCPRSFTRPLVPPCDPWAHIVRVFAASHDPATRVATLDLEYMQQGPVADLPAFAGPPTAAQWPERCAWLRRVAYSCAAGLRTLHDDLRVLHRDVKPANVLVSADGNVKLADFGSSVLLADGQDTVHDQAGTTMYMAPERARGEAHGAASDVWSLGVTVLQLALGGEHPLLPMSAEDTAATSDPFWLLAEATRFTSSDDDCAAAVCVAFATAMGRLASAVRDEEGASSTAGLTDLADFVELCMCTDASSRPTAAALLTHPFVSA
jgi:serine/threonine protein kinase